MSKLFTSNLIRPLAVLGICFGLFFLFAGFVRANDPGFASWTGMTWFNSGGTGGVSGEGGGGLSPEQIAAAILAMVKKDFNSDAFKTALYDFMASQGENFKYDATNPAALAQNVWDYLTKSNNVMASTGESYASVSLEAVKNLISSDTAAVDPRMFSSMQNITLSPEEQKEIGTAVTAVTPAYEQYKTVINDIKLTPEARAQKLYGLYGLVDQSSGSKDKQAVIDYYKSLGYDMSDPSNPVYVSKDGVRHVDTYAQELIQGKLPSGGDQPCFDDLLGGMSPGGG